MDALIKIPVGERTLMRRVELYTEGTQSSLEEKPERLSALQNLGAYFVVDFKLDVSIQSNLDAIDLQSLARAKKVFAECEVLESRRQPAMSVDHKDSNVGAPNTSAS